MKTDSKIPLLVKIKLLLVNLLIKWLNFWLNFGRKILFFKSVKNPSNILIYKVGNIGDVVCAVPSFIAIRKNFPQAKITLLTSPGARGAVGAKDFLSGVWYIDEMKAYYSDEINSLSKIRDFAKNLRKNNYDLFIQLPDDWANFRTLFRNMIFAKLIGTKSAFGFYLRSSWLFRNTQTDYSPLFLNEVESLLGLLEMNGIKNKEINFEFPTNAAINEKIENLFKNFKSKNYELLVALGPGAKFASKEWPLERFIVVCKYLAANHNVGFVVFGGPGDIAKGEEIKNNLENGRVLNLSGELSVLETLTALKKVKFLLSNDTGTVHLAAAVGVPCVALYSVRSPFGKWFPYGENHKVLYHKFLDCDYKQEKCAKQSMEAIAMEDVEAACGDLVKNLEIFLH